VWITKKSSLQKAACTADGSTKVAFKALEEHMGCLVDGACVHLRQPKLLISAAMLTPGSGKVQALLVTLLQNDVGLHESFVSQFSVLGFTGAGPTDGEGDGGDGGVGDGGVGDGGDGGAGPGLGLDPHASSASWGKCVHWVFSVEALSTQEMQS